jgi:hypothetical protein
MSRASVQSASAMPSSSRHNGEVAGVGAQPDPPGPRRGRQRGQRPAQQLGGVAAGVLVAGQQVRGQHGRGVGPAGDVRATDSLALVVERHPSFATAVDLHVGGVQIERHLLTQRRRMPGGQQLQRRRGHVTEPGLHRRPLPGRQPPCQPGRGRGRQIGHRRQLLPGGIGALAVQPNHEVFPGQLRSGHPDQQLPAGMAAAALLDRPDRRVQPADHIQPLDQLGHRHHARHRRQRRIRRPDPHPPPPAATAP